MSFYRTLYATVVSLLLCSVLSKVCCVVLMLQVGGVFIRVFNQRGRSSANASNATVTAATATAAVAAAAPAAAAGGTAHAGPLSVQPSQQQQQQRGSGGGAAAFAGAAAGGSGTPSDPSGFCKALVRYLYDRLVERCFRGAELQQLSGVEARNVLDVVTALSGGPAGELQTYSVRLVWGSCTLASCPVRLPADMYSGGHLVVFDTQALRPTEMLQPQQIMQDWGS